MLKKILCLIILNWFLIPSVTVNSQQIQGLTISPAIIATSQQAGDSKIYTLKIYSDSDKTIDISIKPLYKTSNLNKAIIGDDEISPELLSWFQSYKKQIFIKSNVESIYEVNVVIPEYYLGNYNFAFAFQETSPQVVDSTNNITETSSIVAVPFIFNVVKPGENLYENLNISKYNINPELTFDGKNSFDISLKNDGISYLIPRGILSIKPEKIIGTFQSQDVAINSEKSIILKDGSLDLNLANNFQQNSIGQYKATLTVVYGLQNDVITKEVYFWIIPQWVVIGICIIILLILIFLVRKLRLKK